MCVTFLFPSVILHYIGNHLYGEEKRKRVKEHFARFLCCNPSIPTIVYSRVVQDICQVTSFPQDLSRL